MQCPACGGDMYDNRRTKKNPKAPDFKCKDANCIDPKSGMVTACWMPKRQAPQEQYPDDGQYDPQYDEGQTAPPPQRQAPAPRNITKHTDEKKEMVLSYAKDGVLGIICEFIKNGVITDPDVAMGLFIEKSEEIFDRLILKVRSV